MAASVGDDRSQLDNGLVLAPGADKNLMRFWLRQQKFLELLEQRDTTKALSVLRTELSPLYQDTQKLHFLSSLLMCQSPLEVKMKADWDGADGQSRRLLLSGLFAAAERPGISRLEKLCLGYVSKIEMRAQGGERLPAYG